MYHDRLRSDGYEVLTASDGVEALNVLRETTVDLVLLDLIMPRMGGMEVLEAMHGDSRMSEVPVIVLSGLGEESVTQRALELGAYDFLVKSTAKPADVAEKIGLVLQALGPGRAEAPAFMVYIRDPDGDADALIAHAGLKRRLWCPACEESLVLELIPQGDRTGWYDARLICRMCAREF
jgi:CheY-like chemotaxis protein